MKKNLFTHGREMVGTARLFELFDRIRDAEDRGHSQRPITLTVVPGQTSSGTLNLSDELGTQAVNLRLRDLSLSSLVTGAGADMIRLEPGGIKKAGAPSEFTMSINGGEGRDTLAASGLDLSKATIASIETLVVNGRAVTATVEQLDGFDAISSGGKSRSPVDLILSNSGVLDLSDELSGRSATIRVLSTEGATVTLGAGRDSFVGAAGSDVAQGGAGRDRLAGRAGDDLLHGEAGDDILMGDDGTDALYGGIGRDRLDGGSGRDHLEGGEGKDRLTGGTGDDRLDGGGGNDVLTGGVGDDVFVFSAGQDVVTDFAASDDTILLDSALLGGAEATQDTVRSFAHLEEGDILLAFGDGQSLRIEGVTDLDVLTPLISWF